MKSNFIFKIIAAIILLFSAVTKLIFTEPFEFSLVESGMFCWAISSLVVKGVILLEFLLATSLLLKSIHSKLISVSLILLSSIYVLDIFNKPSSGLFTNEFVFSFYSKWISISAIIYLILFSILLIAENEHNSFKRLKNVLINFCLLLMITTPLLLLNPIFIDDYQINNSEVQNPTLNWNKVINECEKSNIEVDPNESTFFAFLSTSCYYCNRSAKMLGVSGQSSLNDPAIVLVFPGNKKDTEDFIERNNCDFPYILISKDDFRSMAGNQFPAFFKVENKKETHYYTGSTLNLRELDNLFQFN